MPRAIGHFELHFWESGVCWKVCSRELGIECGGLLRRIGNDGSAIAFSSSETKASLRDRRSMRAAERNCQLGVIFWIAWPEGANALHDSTTPQTTLVAEPSIDPVFFLRWMKPTG